MPTSQQAFKPLFIVGYPRSGTTWTMWLLAQHPKVVSSFHGGFFHAMAPLVAWQQTPGAFGKFIVRPKTAENNPPDQRQDRKIDWIEALPDSLLQAAFRKMAHDFFEVIASQASNPAVVVENTPENMVFLEWILDLIPDAHILHVIRDPRSIWLSIDRASRSWLKPNQAGSFPPTLEENMVGWNRYIEVGRKIQERTPHYLEVQYERLKEDGPDELRRIHRWLGLASDSDAYDRAFKLTDLKNMNNLMASPQGFFGKGKTDGWREGLSKSEVKQIEYLVGDRMEELGYSRQLPRSERRPWQLGLSAFMSKASAGLRRRLSRW